MIREITVIISDNFKDGFQDKFHDWIVRLCLILKIIYNCTFSDYNFSNL